MPSSRQTHTRNSFRLLALGGAALVDSTGAVVAEQRRRLALLVLVASGRDRGVSRDKLIAWLSPESATDSARHALHQLLYYLRHQVGDEAFLGTDPLRLNREVVAFDVAEFEAALDAGALEDAVALYRGPFLDGFHLGESAEFEEWAAGERTRLAARHADALARLADAAAARGDHAAACVWWRGATLTCAPAGCHPTRPPAMARTATPSSCSRWRPAPTSATRRAATRCSRCCASARSPAAA